MAYVKISDGAVVEFPYNLFKLKRDNPSTSFPKTMSDTALEEWGVYRVTVDAEPQEDMRYKNVERSNTPVQRDGSWVLEWTVTDKTAEQITEYADRTAEQGRAIRDGFLAETDWWAVSDRTMTAEQTSYRQALRDITTHANWPYLNDEDWPTKP